MQFYLHRCYVTRRTLGIRSRPQTPTLKHPASPSTAICHFSSSAETDVNQRRRVIMIWHISKWHLRHSCKSCTSALSRPPLLWHHQGSQGNTVPTCRVFCVSRSPSSQWLCPHQHSSNLKYSAWKYFHCRNKTHCQKVSHCSKLFSCSAPGEKSSTR